jgi:hypothetical protein
VNLVQAQLRFKQQSTRGKHREIQAGPGRTNLSQTGVGPDLKTLNVRLNGQIAAQSVVIPLAEVTEPVALHHPRCEGIHGRHQRLLRAGSVLTLR